jgi:magnesium chelatase family protein
LSVALAAASSQCQGLIVPYENSKEAALAGCPVFPARHLNEVVTFLTDPQTLSAVQIDFELLLKCSRPSRLDFSEVKAQQSIKRGLEVAAAGGHNVILIGAPGSGKTMLAKRLTTILPDMTPAEVLQTTQIHSVAGLLKNADGIITQRPFRAPHHTASDIAIIGGGNGPRPGEVTLAHNGVLFLDEFLEFNRHVLEVLRQPLEDGYVSVARSKGSFRFPTRFMLIAAMNPCPCGYKDVHGKVCRCSPLQVEKYRHKISGPLLDRIDIHLHALPLKTRELVDAPLEESSAAIKERTTKARQVQWQRFKGQPVLCNAHMESAHLRNFCTLSKEAKGILVHAMEELKFSARAHDKILKVARTIADLAGSGSIEAVHIAEAVGYRSLDRDTF